MTENCEKGVCYIAGAGDFYPHELTPAKGDTVIAADGGYLHFKRMGIFVRHVIGDFDSMDPPRGASDETTIEILPREKDDTDMLAAIRLGLEQGCRFFKLYGGTGGRMDHTIANIQCLAFLAENNARGVLYGENFAFTAIKDSSISFGRRYTGYVSVFSLSDIATGVVLRGLEYELDGATLTNSFPLGVSNRFNGVDSFISVDSGTILICYEL